MNQDTLQNFQTYDLSLAATLATLGFRDITFDRTNPRKVAFIFQRHPGIDEAIQLYWADQQKVNPRVFFDVLKHLKTRIYEES